MHIFACRVNYKNYFMKKVLNILLVSILTFFYSCNSKPDSQNLNEIEKEIKGDLIIFHAGSLSVPFKEMKDEFQKEYPLVNIIMESDGSRKCARKITDLNKPCDIMASADYSVIDNLLIPNYADWNIKFATNEMTIVYHEASKYANEINADNWFKILLKDDVVFGRSDPNSDPCGYRAVLTSQLSEKFYKVDDLENKITSKNINYIRPKETDLLAMLESNTIDYIFLYRSVAQQHGLKYVILPDSINLKNPNLDSYYANAQVEISGKKPSETITQIGQSMVYGITIPKNAPNKDAAEAFVKFVLNKDKGMKIMENNGQASLVPSSTPTFEKIPESLKQFATK